MAIVGTLPNNIQNGQLEDATPLMANFNFILNAINANANPTGTFTAPSGTRMLFNQPSPPVGWAQETGAVFHDCSVRTVNTPTGGSTGGSTVWSGWNYGGVFNLNTFTLSVAQLPVHGHADAGHSHGVNDPGHVHGAPNGQGFWMGNGQSYLNVLSSDGGGGGFGVASVSANIAAQATNVSLQTGYSNNANTGSGAAITPSFNAPQVKYSDYVIGIKT